MPAPTLLMVQDEVWRATAALFEPYAKAGLEAGLFWYGVRTSEAAIASIVGIPRQSNRQTSFSIEADALAALIRRLREPLVVVAQVHTHPGADTKHSSWDDQCVVSRKILSLVLPVYGRNAQLELAGVHEFCEGQWHQLNPPEAAKRIVVAPSAIDMRAS